MWTQLLGAAPGVLIQPPEWLDPSLFWLLGALLALWCAVAFTRKAKLDERVTYWAGTSAILFGLWGGYLLGFHYYGTDGSPWAWLRFWSGGRVEYGGLLVGTLTILIYLRVRRQPFIRYADAIAPGVALGLAVGRVGCFLNGDDFGTRTELPWAVVYPPGTEAYADHVSRGWLAPGATASLPVHPVQLYASLLALGLFVALALLRESPAGTRFALFAGAHGLGRFLLEYERGDFHPVIGPFSLTQLISTGLVLATGVFLAHRVRRSPSIAVSALELSSEGS